MGFLSRGQKDITYGSLIDIGSGSVLVAIIKSDSTKSYPEIIWSKREYSPLRSDDTLTDSAKNVMTSLVSALMQLNSEGRKVFYDLTNQNRLPEAQVTIVAPWSYTITKNINYAKTEQYSLSKELIEELLRTAHQKVEEELQENEKINELGLSVITRSLIGLRANGYNLQTLNNQKTKSLQLVETSAIAQDYMIDALTKACDKVLPESKLYLYSFVLIYYYILKQLHTDTNEFCLVDITYEATELGVVRDGFLNYTTHTEIGSFTLARKIAKELKVPVAEAFGYLHQKDPISLLEQYPATKIEAIKDISLEYQRELASLFHETGDGLAIPKKIYIHGNLQTEDFFINQVSQAAKLATNSSHAVYPVSKEIISKYYPGEIAREIQTKNIDTALLISAQFFHMRDFHSKFEHP